MDKNTKKIRLKEIPEGILIGTLGKFIEIFNALETIIEPQN